ncbi:phage major capsid protein [Rhodanobacter glycinis]|uniref:phage major capsid protein n=1 Tax=Rhodanobacter glycinis TaxID=582702 RepID=UPI00112E0A1C|nr:phage major capsid protein [Rhodanobacter glycinis]TPG45513.1 phage major capsid protein [Rhodanobacter glycinis]
MQIPNMKGREFIRIAVTKASVGGAQGVEAFTAARYGSDGPRIAKAAIASLNSSELLDESIATAFISTVVDKSVLGQLRGARPTPFNTRTRKLSSGARGHFVAEAAPIPLSKQSVEGSTLRPLKVYALVVSTKEAISSLDPLAEAGLQSDLQTACAAAVNIALLNPANAGTANVTPAAITFGAPTVAATGNAVADIKVLIAAFKGDISAAYFVTDPDTATALAMVQTANDAFLFPECGPRGGAILGIPLVTTIDSPRDSSGGQLALIDPTGIAYNIDDVQMDVAKNATLAMSDSPTSPVEQVSLFQTSSVAWKVLIRANWENHRASGVAVLTGIV